MTGYRRSRLALMGLVATMMVARVGSAEPFMIFDATQFTGKPNLARLGITPLTVVYSKKEWWSDRSRLDLPPQAAFQRQLADAIERNAPRPGDLIVLDIENWHVQYAEERLRGITNFRQVLRWVRELAPTYRFAFYGMLPVPGYYEPLAPVASARRNNWQQGNRDMAALVPDLDAIMPSLYTFVEDGGEWNRAAVEILKEARRYGKPVYPFIWYEYHDSASIFLALTPISAELWTLQLETAFEHADGVVIWGGWDWKLHRPAPWNERDPWWVATKSFIARHKLAGKR